LNEVHEAACALYIRHKYNQSVVDAFVGDECFGANRFVVFQERIGTTVKTAQKLSAATESAVGITGAPSAEKATSEAEEARDSLPSSRHKEVVSTQASEEPTSKREPPVGSSMAGNRSASTARSSSTTLRTARTNIPGFGGAPRNFEVPEMGSPRSGPGAMG